MYILIAIIVLIIGYALYNSLKRNKAEKRYIEQLNANRVNRTAFIPRDRIVPPADDVDYMAKLGEKASKRAIKELNLNGAHFLMPIITNHKEASLEQLSQF